MASSIVTDAEDYVHGLAHALTAPRRGECLPCYLDRVLRDVSCDGTLRLSQAFRDAVSPRATSLERRLQDRGGFCDCEVLMNVYCSLSDDVLPCRGINRGSTQPCALWHPHRRGEPW